MPTSVTRQAGTYLNLLSIVFFVEPEAHWKKPVLGYEPRVPVWKRILALIIDILLFNVTVAVPLSGLVPASFTATSTVLAVGVVLVALFFGYLVASQYLIGQTIGMMLFQYRATNTNELWRCVVRNIFILPVFPFILLWIIDPLFLAFTGDRLTERWAGSTTELM